MALAGGDIKNSAITSETSDFFGVWVGNRMGGISVHDKFVFVSAVR